jgi:hypothetical protein
MSSDTAPASIPQPVFGPPVVSIPVTVDIPANLLPLYSGIKTSFSSNDSKVVTDCVRFALFCYQQGLVGKSDSLMESLVNQVAAFDALRERIQQSQSAVRQAVFVSSAAVTAVHGELKKRGEAFNSSE